MVCVIRAVPLTAHESPKGRKTKSEFETEMPNFSFFVLCFSSTSANTHAQRHKKKFLALFNATNNKCWKLSHADFNCHRILIVRSISTRILVHILNAIRRLNSKQFSLPSLLLLSPRSLRSSLSFIFLIQYTLFTRCTDTLNNRRYLER